MSPRFSSPLVVVAIGAWLLSACAAPSSVATPDDDAPLTVSVDLSGASGGQQRTPTADSAGGSTPDGPLSGPVGQWTWFDVPGAVCGLGQPTGVAVNVGTSSDVVIYMEGGGLCWDEASRLFNVDGSKVGVPALGDIAIAHNFTTGVHDANFIPATSGLLDRKLANNPYKDSSFVLTPYCTGDLHVGSTTQPFQVSKQTGHFAGRKNLELYLAEILATFPHPSRVTLSGASAGGFGSLLNYDRVAQAFGTTRVDLITDSGPLFWDHAGPLLPGAFPAWNAKAVLPADCADCVANPAALYPYLSKKYPASRFAFLSHDEDLPISAGVYGLIFYPSFYFAVKDLTLNTLAPLPNWRYFVAAGTSHTFEFSLTEASVQQNTHCNSIFGLCAPQTTVLAVWLTKLATDDPTWPSTTSISQ